MSVYILKEEEIPELYEFILNLEEDTPRWFEIAFMPYEKFENLLDGEIFDNAENFEDVKNIMERDYYEMCEDKEMQAMLLERYEEISECAEAEEIYLGTLHEGSDKEDV